jgi:hypothetical protein
VFLLAVAIAPCVASPARAACGDYVHIASSVQRDSPKPTKCHGANCSKPIEHAPLLPATTVTWSAEEIAHFTLRVDDSSDRGEALAAIDPELHLLDHVFRLERPPRA